MAVALATLPLNRLLADAGDAFLVAGAGVGTDLTADAATGLGVTLTGLTTGLLAGFATGLATGLAAAAAFLATGLAIVFPAVPALTLLFLAGAFVGAAFLATTFLAATFLMTGFLMTGFLMTAFLMAGFFAADFPALVFFTATFPATFLAEATFFGGGLGAAFLAAAGLATTFLVAGLATALLTVFFAGVLALFTVRPFVAAVFDLPVPEWRALSGVFPFCALAAVELRVVFAISLHRFWPWRPGVIADVFYTSKPASGILVPLPAASRSGNVNLLTRLILWLIGLYKRGLSPLLGPRCRFHPSCSDYARIAVSRFGPWRGSVLAGWRLLRCQPLCTGDEDPVPEHFHFRRCHSSEDSIDR